MHQDTTWCGGRPPSRRHDPLLSPPPTERGTVRLCGFRHISSSGLGVGASRASFIAVFAFSCKCKQSFVLLLLQYKYTVSQKTSHLWLAITLMHVNGFWYFLAEMLPIMYAIKRRFAMPPKITCPSALPVKMGKHENHIFHSIGSVSYTHLTLPTILRV